MAPIRRLWVALVLSVQRGTRAITAILVVLFGRWRWEAPAWFTPAKGYAVRGRRYLAADPKRAAILAVLLISAIGGYIWYASRPRPHYVGYSIIEPELTTYNDSGIESIHPMQVVFSESAAPLKQVGTTVTAGIALSPAIAGTWFWISDTELQFTPKADWPVDGAFTVKLSKKAMLAPQVELEDYSFKFRSQPFSARITESQFYQDPQDPNLKKIVATVTFSHPVDAERFESRVSLAVAKDAEYLGLTPDSRHFTVAYDKFKLAAYIHSSPLAMPRDDTQMTLLIDRGVRAARGGNDIPDRLEAVVTIPGRASLRFFNPQMTVVDNARYEPEQILLLTSSSPVAERAFDAKVTAQLLPVRHPRQPKEDTNPYEWRDVNEIGADILANCESVGVSYVPSDEGGNTAHGFKFNAPVGRYLYVMVKDNVQGTGGYISAKPFLATIKVVPYPQTLKFLGQGALLPLSGDRTVGYLARDVSRVQVEIGRVLPNQLQHLAQAMWDFTRPSLYPDLEDKLVERFVTTRDYSSKPPGKPTYDSIDVGQYLKDQTQSRRGLFVLRIRQISARQAGGDEGGDSGGDYSWRNRSVEDVRLILVTDLGFVVKQAIDGSRDVFVQSIGTGLPVEGARVDLVGRNGLAVLSATTDAGGRARLPKPSDQLRREKSPQLLTVQKDTDISFLPFNTNGRNLSVSRFDTGGVVNAKSAQQLSTYLFSDRGIYRPGETAHLGVITRTADWKASLSGLPLDLEITDPRGVVVSRSQLTLSDASFDEISYTSPSAAPTGTYEAVAYLAKDEKRREPLGSTSFKVQEFEPDRMKVHLDLSSKPIDSWLRPDDVMAQVTVAHLFGGAAGNRRIEGEMSLTPALPRFDKYPDYRFSTGEGLKDPYYEKLAAGVTDENGTARFNLDLKRFVGRAYRLNVLGRAYEAEGGRNVAAQGSAIVSEASYLVGIKPDGDLSFVRRTSARAARWLAVNQQLAPVAADGLTLQWVQRKFVSVLTKQYNGTMQYVSRQKEIVRSSRGVSIAAGGSTFPLPTDEPGDFVLVLRDASGAALNSLGYSVAGDANLSRSLEREAELQIQLDKPEYAGGDTILVSIHAPYIGAGLITVERDRVVHHQWFKTTTTSSVQRITLPADFEGNGYICVQFLRDPSSDELFMSPLSYGIAAFKPNLAARTQALTLTAPKLIKPGAVLTMKLSPGEPSRVAVLAVDEGILQFARYKNPDPLGYFFQKRMLEVETKQILDLVLPDLKRFIALAAPGGDGEAGFARHLNPFNKKRKSPVAYWSGVMDVGREGKELKYTVPDYFNGRLRIVAIGASARRMGVTEVTADVKGDFILTPNVPATVAAGDEFIVSVGVFNNSGGSGPVHIEAQLGPSLSLVGPGTVDLQIPEKMEGVGEFRVKANATLGAASLTFAARRGTAAARVEESVGVRPAAAFRTQLTLGRVEGAGKTVPLGREMYGEQRKVEAAVSTLPLVWGQALTAYLENYEYTCTEQLVSKGFSALILLTRPEFGSIKKPGAQPLEATFSTLRSRMNELDGLGLWTSTPETAEFATIYGAHFLIEARDRGQVIPSEILTRLDAWLTRFASTPASTLGDARLRAYAVYLLARQGIKAPPALSNVEHELTNRYTKNWPTDLAAAYLASTYRLMQRNDDADRIIKTVPWSTQKRDFGEEVYYDAVVHDAQLLYLLAKHFPSRLGAAPPASLETMSQAVSGTSASSLSASYTLLALDAYARAGAGTATFGISEIGKDGKERVLTLPAGAMPKVSVAETAAQVKFTQRGAALSYYAIHESGFDKRPPTTEMAQGVEIIREFVDGKGSPISKVTVGDEFFVRIRIRATNRDRQQQIVIVDLLPGGVEPVVELQPSADSSTPYDDPAMRRRRGASRSLPVGLADKSDWSPDHIDVREDRLILYGDAGRNVGTFVYRVRANNAGVFQAPPAFAEGMYNRMVVGLSRATSLEVTKK
jgi:alpha-2-macroglobulin